MRRWVTVSAWLVNGDRMEVECNRARYDKLMNWWCWLIALGDQWQWHGRFTPHSWRSQCCACRLLASLGFVNCELGFVICELWCVHELCVSVWLVCDCEYVMCVCVWQWDCVCVCVWLCGGFFFFFFGRVGWSQLESNPNPIFNRASIFSPEPDLKPEYSIKP